MKIKIKEISVKKAGFIEKTTFLVFLLPALFISGGKYASTACKNDCRFIQFEFDWLIWEFTLWIELYKRNNPVKA